MVKFNICYIDDDPNDISLLKIKCGDLPVVVHSFNQGKEVKGEFDLILTDLHLAKGKMGLELVTHLKETHNTPIYILSGLGGEFLKPYEENEQVAGCLNKNTLTSKQLFDIIEPLRLTKLKSGNVS